MSDHLATLQPYLKLHEADVAALREQVDTLRTELHRQPQPDDPKPPLDREMLTRDIERLEQSIATHEGVMDLARDPRLGELLQAVAGDPALAMEAAADPHAFAARTGVELPNTLVIAMQVSAGGVSARITNLDDAMPFEVTWTQDGFPPPPQPVETT